GSATVQATSGSVTGTASVTVTNTAPTVATSASATPGFVTDTSTLLGVQGSDLGGESNLTYTWSLTGSPPAPVLFSDNGTNSAKSTSATFSKAGSYDFLVTITDAGGLTATSNVSVDVSQTLTSIAINPPSANLSLGGSQTFTATALDQFGAPLSSQPAFN